MTNKKDRISRWAVARLMASGALLGVAVAGLLGVDTSMVNTLFGASGAAVTAVVLKAAHIF